jgi:hypothetical protein
MRKTINGYELTVHSLKNKRPGDQDIVLIISENEPTREFASSNGLAGYYYERGGAVADTLAEVVPAPILSAMVAELMGRLFNTDNRSTERSQSDGG